MKARLTAATFDLAAQRTRMGRDPRGRRAFDAARAILVDGKLATEAARAQGINYRTASKAARQILKLAMLDGVCPKCGK